MAKFDFENTTRFALGGLGVEKIHIDGCGNFFGFDSLFGCSSRLSFIIKAQTESCVKTRALCSDTSLFKDILSFEESSVKGKFPFVEIDFYDKDFPAKVSLCAMTPFIVFNDTDSGIPSVFFEIKVENTSEEPVDFSICCLCENPFAGGINRLGCSESGDAYIEFGSCGENQENICVSTNEKNISFCEMLKDIDEFEKSFTSNDMLPNIPFANNSSKRCFGAIGGHFSLCQNQKHTSMFNLSWFIPSNKDGKRVYYTNYFESSVECASYCFSHYDRLFKDSKTFCDLVFNSTLPERTLDEINKSLWAFANENFLRVSNGAVFGETYERFSDLDSFVCRSGVLSVLFPDFEYAEVKHLYKECLEDDGEVLFGGERNYERQLLLVLRSYRKYILSCELDELIEDWYYIVKTFEYFCSEENKNRLDKNVDGRISLPYLQEIYSACLYAMTEMAKAVGDKKRCEKYTAMYKNVPMQQALDFSTGFAKLSEFSGFSYDSTQKHISFSPMSDECPLDFGGTFRCPFFTPDCYGYVEEGIDYIEINILSGGLDVRSFGVPRIPRMVKYGGRNWRFENKENTAVLDSELQVTQSKKLTIFIDIKR